MPPTRRHFLWMSSAAALSGCARGLDLGLTGFESFDEMLVLLHTTAVDFDNGLSNHAPMGAEALVALGAPDRAVPWVAEYSTRLTQTQDRALLAQVDALVLDMEADGPAALRLMLPWLASATARTALGFATQAAAAAIAAEGHRPVPAADDGPSSAEIAERGTTDEDEHTIKLAEAVLRELDHAPAPELRAAFARW